MIADSDRTTNALRLARRVVLAERSCPRYHHWRSRGDRAGLTTRNVRGGDPCHGRLAERHHSPDSGAVGESGLAPQPLGGQVDPAEFGRPRRRYYSLDPNSLGLGRAGLCRAEGSARTFAHLRPGVAGEVQ